MNINRINSKKAPNVTLNNNLVENKVKQRDRSCSLERRLSGAASDQKPADSESVEINRTPLVFARAGTQRSGKRPKTGQLQRPGDSQNPTRKSEQKQILRDDVFRHEKH